MKLQEKQAKFAENVSALIAYIIKKGFTCTLGEAFRTKEQAAIYAKAGKGIVDSLHCERLAIDLNLFDPHGNYLTHSDDYKQFGDFWKTLHPSHRWGGDFKRQDGNHFEMQNLD